MTIHSAPTTFRAVSVRRVRPIAPVGRVRADLTGLTFRRAVAEDIPAIRALHRESMLTLGQPHYGRDTLDGFLAAFETVDPEMITEGPDGSYVVAESEGRIVASGGWTMRRPSYATPANGPSAERVATLRAIFVHPHFARRGIGREILELAETESVLIGGAERIELYATLSGLSLYCRAGYAALSRTEIALPGGTTFTAVHMAKQILGDTAAAA